MKKYLPIVLAGALSLPFTYELNRSGSLGMSVLLIAILAVLGVIVSSRVGRLTWWRVAVWFACGALLSEIAIYLYWFLDYGYQDPKGHAGLAVAVIEGGSIALLGAIVGVVAYLLICRITSASTATR